MSEINAIARNRATRLDVDDLPVRLDVVVGEKEFTLKEIQNLTEGSILDLSGAREAGVRLKLNGRFAADGELLEIDGRLGVRILTWKQAS
jgi:type III secretion protein Q